METGRSLLPDRRQKRKLNVTSCSWKTKLGILQTEKNYLLAFLTFVCGTEGERATSPSSASGNGSIYASRSSPEAQIERYFLQLEDEVGHFTNGKKLPACISYLCSWRRGREGNVALFCKWKRVDLCFQIVARSANCTLLLAAGRRSWAFYKRKKNYLLALSIFVHGVEGDEATSPSFTAGNEAIDASSSSLEALIATL